MDRRTLVIDIAVALVAGVVATRVTDHAQRLLYRLTPVSQKMREPSTEPTSLVAARKTADAVGVRDRRALPLLRSLIHYGLGAGWGSVYALLRRGHQMTPLGAGAMSGVTLSVLIDEALCPAMGLSAPSNRYPASAHVRGFATHLVYGLALAACAEGLRRLMAPGPSLIRT